MHNLIKQTAFLGLASYGTLVQSAPLEARSLPQSSRNPHRARHVANALERRQNSGITNVACGMFSSASVDDSNTNLSNLSSKGGTVVVAANSCSRIGCYNTSGMYVCNDQSVSITLQMSDVTQALSFVLSTCTGDNGSISGQAFSSADGGYNVDIGFCDGQESPSTPPSAYGPNGPNGASGRQCGGNLANACPSSSTCDTGSIVMTSQEEVTCNEYMAPAYIGPGGIYSYSTTRSVSEAWTVGGFLGIDSSDLADIAGNAGFFASFSKTTTTGNVAGSSQQCGSAIVNGVPPNPGWTCGMDVSPGCYQMSGTCTAGSLGTVPWTVIAPQTDSADGIGVFSQNLCICQDCPGWADDGAPQGACNLPCAKCDAATGGAGTGTQEKEVTNGNNTLTASGTATGSATAAGLSGAPSSTNSLQEKLVGTGSATLTGASGSGTATGLSGAPSGTNSLQEKLVANPSATPLSGSATPGVSGLPSEEKVIANTASASASPATSSSPAFSATPNVVNDEVVNTPAASTPTSTPASSSPAAAPSGTLNVVNDQVVNTPASNTLAAPATSSSPAPALSATPNVVEDDVVNTPTPASSTTTSSTSSSTSTITPAAPSAAPAPAGASAAAKKAKKMKRQVPNWTGSWTQTYLQATPSSRGDGTGTFAGSFKSVMPIIAHEEVGKPTATGFAGGFEPQEERPTGAIAGSFKSVMPIVADEQVAKPTATFTGGFQPQQEQPSGSIAGSFQSTMPIVDHEEQNGVPAAGTAAIPSATPIYSQAVGGDQPSAAPSYKA